MRRLAALALLALLGLTASPAAAETAPRYTLAGECRALQVGGGVVGRAGSGYIVRAASPEPLHFKATALGSYMLRGSDGRLLAAAPLGNGVLASSQAGPRAAWEPVEAGADLRFVNVATGRALAVNGLGQLVQTTGAGASFATQPASGCAPFPEITTNASGAPPVGESPYAEVLGTVDAHNHVTAYEFLGGDAHCGEPWNRYGAPAALVDCPDHHPNGSGAVLENALYGDPLRMHDPVGWPTFRDWPAPKSMTHEQTYYRWIERAWLGGVRIMVNDLVENVALCEVYPIKHNSCDDMTSVRLQAQRIRELEEYVDAQAGGPGEGWFRIVRDPFEARRVVNEGKLAVVLGIETSEVFGCGGSEQQPRCDREAIVRGLDEAEAMGVASLFPIHKFDNALGGVRFDSGTFGAAINAANFKQTGQFWQIEACAGPEQDNPQDTALPPEGDVIGAGLAAFLPRGTLPLYPPPPHCNARSLTELGEFLVEEMIDRGLMIELDHMGVKTGRRVLELAEARGYSGILASHSWSDPHVLSRIYSLGGFVEPITTEPEHFIEEWQQLRAASDPRFRFGIGFGADANGFHAQPPARGAGAPTPVTYPFQSLDGAVTFDRQISGQRVYDVNADGVAHYGLYPDWMEQLRLLAGEPIAADLMSGAEAYLQTWERSVGVPAPACMTAPQELSATGFGPLRLGLGAEQTLRIAGQPARRAASSFSWCATGESAPGADDAGVAVVFGEAGRTELVLSTAAAEGRPPGAVSLGHGLFVERGDSGDRLWGYRNGRLRFTAAADPALTGEAAALAAALREAGGP
ncbi:MAG TPA: Coagulation factor 5/8 type domain-containing protein [Solirubrobacterales bacterium]|nr:Coagulation factor 5/8 type domain-containing protein [Solirubrobacterales bacterium]